MGAGVDVAEDGREIQPAQRLNRRSERKGRHDHFACQIQSVNSDFQRDRSIACRYAVPRPGQPGDLLFELPDEFSVGEPPALQHSVDQFE